MTDGSATGVSAPEPETPHPATPDADLPASVVPGQEGDDPNRRNGGGASGASASDAMTPDAMTPDATASEIPAPGVLGIGVSERGVSEVRTSAPTVGTGSIPASADAEAGGDGSRHPGGEPGLHAALEAILLVVDEPVAEVTLAQVLERPTGEVAAALRRLAAEYTASGRGFDLREVAGGWRFYTRAECAPLVERFVRDGQQTRLTQAALETLAVVAYRQPVSRARVSAVRGVNSDGVMRTLVARGLVEEAGTDPETQAVLYRTTSYFLERLGLRDLDELPELAPFLPDDIESLEEQK